MVFLPTLQMLSDPDSSHQFIAQFTIDPLDQFINTLLHYSSMSIFFSLFLPARNHLALILRGWYNHICDCRYHRSHHRCNQTLHDLA